MLDEYIFDAILKARGLVALKSAAEAERAWFSAEGRKSEAEQRGAFVSLGRTTPSFQSELGRTGIKDISHLVQ